MWEIADVKATGKAAFKVNYWRSVVAGLLLTALTMGSSASSVGSNTGAPEAATDAATTEVTELSNSFNALSSGEQAGVVAVVFGIVSIGIIAGLLLKIFVFNPLQVGSYGFFKNNVEEDGDATLGVILEGFNNYGHVFCTLFLRDLLLMLWTLLLVIPGIIKSYSYMLVPYLLRDEPELSATEAINRSKELMEGNKMQAFKLDLSFIGWALFGILTLGLGFIFWTNPYYENTRAALYLELTEQATDSGAHMR